MKKINLSDFEKFIEEITDPEMESEIQQMKIDLQHIVQEVSAMDPVVGTKIQKMGDDLILGVEDLRGYLKLKTEQE